MIIKNLPFHIGPTDSPSNPPPLPNAIDFEFVFDKRMGVLRQTITPELRHALHSTYEKGQCFGTPLAGDTYGKPYADDFLNFVFQSTHGPARALEIGAGVGYLSRRLIDAGWLVFSLEPGYGYAPYWAKYEINVIQEFFPTPRIEGLFDLIVAYGVLEHIEDLSTFLENIKKYLALDGVAIFSVPDCTQEIAAGDPSILMHEHLTYFNNESLHSILEEAGFDVNVEFADYGRCLYATARKRKRTIFRSRIRADYQLLESYPECTKGYIERIKEELNLWSVKGSLGFYTAARGFAFLDSRWPIRFFDDDTNLHGKFYPPFTCAIENRADLLIKPVDTLVILSRTFGHQIKDILLSFNYSGCVLCIEDL